MYSIKQEDFNLTLVICWQGGFTAEDAAGWAVSLIDGRPVKFSLATDSTGISGTDSGAALWYFQASSSFSGNFINAYNGKIEVFLHVR